MPRSDVYDPDAFAYRVTFAAAVIARGGETTRRFDATGEMNDGEAVTAALVRRAKANPGGNLARNLFRYIGEEQALEHYEETKHLTVRGLTEYAATLPPVTEDKVQSAVLSNNDRTSLSPKWNNSYWSRWRTRRRFQGN